MAEQAGDLLAAGNSALATGDWAAARAAFESVLGTDDVPEARDGLGRALWWIEGPAPAVAERTRAYAGHRARGQDREAAHVALWLAHEYAVGLRNLAASNGWANRATHLLERLPEGPDHVRLELVRSERAGDALDARQHAKTALEIARRLGDTDLEITALGRLGLCEVRVGAVESGLSRLDEAMAAALGGEAAELETIGELCCTLIAACDETGDLDRLRQWNRLLGEATHVRQELPVLSFCGCCSAETMIAGGRLEDAERELGRSLRQVERGGAAPRCVDPRARLADLLVRQGRFEEAEQLLPGSEGDGWTVRARAELHLARGEAGAAAVVLERRLRQVGSDSLLAVSVLDLLVQARLAAHDGTAAEDAARLLEALAESSGIDRVRAYAERARGRVLAGDDPATAADRLGRAAEAFARLGMRLERGRTRLDLALVLRDVDRLAAIEDARSALADLHAEGASHDRDRAAALLRELGDASRPVSVRRVDRLTQREVEVLRLLGEGLTDAEIGARLFISTKTVGHHVSSILAKLEVPNRSRAAVLASQLEPEQGAV